MAKGFWAGRDFFIEEGGLFLSRPRFFLRRSAPADSFVVNRRELSRQRCEPFRKPSCVGRVNQIVNYDSADNFFHRTRFCFPGESVFFTVPRCPAAPVSSFENQMF
jgi:hypothetical protein